jgi:hypothetical protein
LTIGAQQIKGFSELEWLQYLDAAAYPASSALPASYRRPTATPLVALEKQAPAKPPETPTSKVLPVPLPIPVQSPSNPAGIQF